MGCAVRDSVTVVCYGREEVWASRKDAIAFYTDGVRACDGSERDRYVNVLIELMCGLKICTDGE